jgi:superfamily I DNA/RNA helicase
VVDEFSPTPEQDDIIKFEPSGHLLIRGEAGSGKTTVLTARARHLQNDMFSGNLLFLTFNVALARYIEKLLKNFGCEGNITVSTVHQWASNFYRDAKGQGPRLVKGDERIQMILDAKTKQCEDPRWRENHLAKEIDEFWDKEIEWIVGQGLSRLEQYKKMKRIGRGTAIQVRDSDREFIWAVFSAYKDELNRQERFDNYDLFGIIKFVLPVVDGSTSISPNQRYDHILLDEVQDFYLSWLMIMVPFASRSLTLAGDLGQRIYRRGFSWKNAKVKVTGNRSRSLAGSLRTTKQIMEVAIGIVKNDDIANEDSDNDYIARTIPKKEGPKVRLLTRASFRNARSDTAKEISRLWKSSENTDDQFVVAANGKSARTELKRLLSDINIPSQIALREDLVTLKKQIPITTLYQLKGLEFDHVILFDLGDESMPTFWAEKLPLEKPEEAEFYLRRLLYVAMTRARKSVTLAGAAPFCRFFDDVPSDLFENI